MVWRPFYFGNLIVDPQDENKIFKPDLILLLSNDGGTVSYTHLDVYKRQRKGTASRATN